MTTLRNEIENDPLGIGYAAMTDGELEAALNAKTRTRIVAARIGVGSVMSALGASAGAALLDTLEVIAASNSPVKWALRLLAADNLDIGNAETRAQIDALAAAGVMTVEQAATLKALAEQPCSRAEELAVNAIGASIRNARA
jgi:hypothetical protein